LGLCPRPRWGAYSAPTILRAGFERAEATSKRREKGKKKEKEA